MKVSKSRVLAYSVGIILIILFGAVTARCVAITRAWWYALENGEPTPFHITTLPYPSVTTPRHWSTPVARFALHAKVVAANMVGSKLVEPEW